MSKVLNTVSAYRSLLQEEDDDLKELNSDGPKDELSFAHFSLYEVKLF